MIKNQISYKQVVHKIVLLVFIVGLSSFIFSSNDDQNLIGAINDDQVDRAIELIQFNRIDLNLKNRNYRTALMFACDKGHKKIVEVLIVAGADLNIQDNNRWTALMIACEKGNEEIAQILIDAGADFNIQNDFGDTALMVACEKANKKIAQILIDSGADLDIQDCVGSTALMWSCDKGHKEIVQMLLDAGADFNIEGEVRLNVFAYGRAHLQILSVLNWVKENRLSNCYCKWRMCNICKTIIQTLPILKSNKSNLNKYIKQVEIIIDNNQINKKLAIKILNELITYNNYEAIKLKNRLRVLSRAECKECNRLECRECGINVNSANELFLPND